MRLQYEGIKGTVFCVINKPSLPLELVLALYNDFFIFYKSSIHFLLHFPTKPNAHQFSLSPFNVNLDKPWTLEVLKKATCSYVYRNLAAVALKQSKF